MVIDGHIICAVVRGMGAHPSSLAIQEEGMRVLRLLSYRTPDNQMLIARRGGISAMIAAMRSHACSMTLQEEACRLICNLAENAAILTELLVSKNIQAILAAQLAFPRNAPIEVCAKIVCKR